MKKAQPESALPSPVLPEKRSAQQYRIELHILMEHKKNFMEHKKNSPQTVQQHAKKTYLLPKRPATRAQRAVFLTS